MVEKGGLMEELISAEGGMDLRKHIQAPIEAGMMRAQIEVRAYADRMTLRSLAAVR